jgi:orotidine-5'-phosphate decarboxylase
MNSYEKLTNAVVTSNSLLCVGLDSDIARMPESIEKNMDGILDFNIRIIEATAAYTAAYKINFAFYEQYGTPGFEILKKTIETVPTDKFIIADAKRGDIGNTSKSYAKSAFEYFNADALTVNPYMGSDSLKPFLEYEDKMIFILALTSNPGSADFQHLISDGEPLYINVIKKTSTYGNKNNSGYVVGATHPEELSRIREIIPEHFLLIPGIGTQGGDAKSILQANGDKPTIINVSRDIIYQSSLDIFAEAAAGRAKYYQELFNE